MYLDESKFSSEEMWFIFYHRNKDWSDKKENQKVWRKKANNKDRKEYHFKRLKIVNEISNEIYWNLTLNLIHIFLKFNI